MFKLKVLTGAVIISLMFQVTSAKATVVDLAQNLRDGVLLCLLLNKLSPGAVDKNDISQRPQMSQFLCLKNIRTFLQVRFLVAISFGLPLALLWIGNFFP